MPLSPDFIAELRKHFTGDVRLDATSRVLYSTDASIYQIEPLGVAFPKSKMTYILSRPDFGWYICPGSTPGFASF